ncbi:hypothetical protein E2C01_048236 [Portunus trituberculatus]|uniref:Uncharacterized protein n=1 Tax=Portunus trituberculatus TaxID=210409 RepID=A0A5B7GA17_PORTR|nr:hypothetical protein [Portunus trituberculatus]
MDMFYDNFKQSRSEVLRTIAARMEMVPHHKDGLTRCLTENAAYLFEGLFIEVMIAEDFTDRWQSTPLYVTRNNLLADFTAFLLIRDAPFKPNFDYCLITFQGPIANSHGWHNAAVGCQKQLIAPEAHKLWNPYQ